MATTKLNNGQLPTTLSSKTIDNTNDINTTTTKLKISGGSNGQVLSTDGSGNLSWATAGGGGGVSDGDKGDITVSSSGATWTIDNGVVTYAKMQDVSATNRLLGRATAGSGDVEEITIGSGLTLTGTTLSAAGGSGTYEPAIIVVKTANETVTSSATLQDDDHLTCTLDADSYYYGELQIFFSRTNTSSANGPRVGGSAGSLGYLVSTRGTEPTILNGTSANIDGNQITSGLGVVAPSKYFVAILTGGSTQTFQFKWAQIGSNTNSITIHKGSRLVLWKTATA